MRKLLLVVAIVALAAWVISWFWAGDAVTASAARPWPGGMGPLTTAGDRVDPLHANGAAKRLTALAGTLPKSDAVADFLRREVVRGDLGISQPPALAELSAIRELLLHEPVVWERREGIGGGNDSNAERAVQLTVVRALVASALSKARANDPAAWEDLHAAWNLARSLEGHPQMMAQTAALTTARLINAVAWKMPLPPPGWLNELQECDNVRPLLEAFQHQTASYANDGLSIFPTKVLARSVDRDRGIAEALAGETRCDVNTGENESGTDLRSVWRRAFRYRAEREATANALRVREGKKVENVSRCSDGAWTLDGATLRFSREIKTAAPDSPMPLVLRVGP
jgi:hypothetical protein